MPDPYPVVEIQAEWLLDEPEEEMGSKRKFWYREEEDGSDWLFKFPRPNTGEHWVARRHRTVVRPRIVAWQGAPGRTPT